MRLALLLLLPLTLVDAERAGDDDKQAKEMAAIADDAAVVETEDQPEAPKEKEELKELAAEKAEEETNDGDLNATDSDGEEILPKELVTEAATTAPVPVATTAVPAATTVAPAETEAAALPETSKPALRSESGPAVAAAADATASESVREYLNQGNPLILAGFAVICCFFLLLWGRKRRLASLSSTDGGASGSAAVETGASAAGAPAAKKINSKVQYSRIDDHFEAESPFSRTHGDDSDDYDDEDEDGFGQDRDKWDDWEPEESKASPYDSDPNPFAAPVGVKFGAVSAPKPAASIEAPTFKLNPPPSTNLVQSTHSQSAVREIELGSTATSHPGKNVDSNSSSDSFEVVVDEPAPTGYPLFPAPAPKSHPKEEKKEEKKESVDDLFSQFGMVPTFKKGVQQQPAPVASTTHADVSSSRESVTSASPSSATGTSLPSAAEASALFAAELDDLGITAAADDWGEDDEWVKGI